MFTQAASFDSTRAEAMLCASSMVSVVLRTSISFIWFGIQLWLRARASLSIMPVFNEISQFSIARGKKERLMAYRKKRISHKREIYYLFCILAVMAILLMSFFGPSGYRELQKARLELQEQHTRVDQLEQENAERLQRIEKLRSDKSTLEEAARESGFARPEEIIQQIPKKSAKQKTNKPSNSRQP